MMKLSHIAVPALLLGALGAGWLSAGLIGAPAAPTSVAASTLPRAVHPAAGTAAAAQRIADFGAGLPRRAPASPRVEVASAHLLPAAPRAEPQKAAAPRLPSIDVAVQLRREITALADGPRGPALWIVDPVAPAMRRALYAGDRYRDGWRVAAIEEQFVVLRRGRERRHIAIFEAPPEEQRTLLASAPVARPVSAAQEPVEIAVAPTEAAASEQPSDKPRRPRRLLRRPAH